jgi:hypothetical protein
LLLINNDCQLTAPPPAKSDQYKRRTVLRTVDHWHVLHSGTRHGQIRAYITRTVTRTQSSTDSHPTHANLPPQLPGTAVDLKSIAAHRASRCSGAFRSFRTSHCRAVWACLERGRSTTQPTSRRACFPQECPVCWPLTSCLRRTTMTLEHRVTARRHDDHFP